jgi:hypothetical protein
LLSAEQKKINRSLKIMNSRFTLGLLLALSGTLSIPAQVPGIITYQGRVTAGGTNYNGTGYFKFALYNGINGQSLWSNNGTSVNGSEPTARVSAQVADGIFTVRLGDTTLVGMTLAIPASAFVNADLRLRIWFSAGEPVMTQLAPDQRLTSAGYALRADNVLDGAITSVQIADGAVGTADLANDAVITPKLANGSITTVKLADNSVTPTKIPDDSITGQKIAPNSITGEDIAEPLHLHDLRITGAGGLDRLQLTEENNSGVLYMNYGNIGRVLAASGTTDGGFLRLYDAQGGLSPAQTTVELGSSSLGGYVNVFQDNRSSGVIIQGQNGSTAGGAILLYRETGLGMVLRGSTSAGQGSLLTMYNGLGDATVVLDADASGRASFMQLLRADGSVGINLDADSAGEGRITTQVLEITGGSDFSENFDIQTPDAQPGMIVSIDPAHPGELAVSAHAYDHAVAGIVSGAGGVKPGMLMGQRGSKADGRHPVALTGRVYCLVDAGNGAVQPGDLITTSNTPGHGMKATDPARAQGAVIGKAMTGLASGQGLVLVLVSLQ